MYWRVGTDFSGIDCVILGMIKYNIPYQHIFSNDINKFCIQQIKANYKPLILFGDPEGPYPDGNVKNRDHSKLPDIDLYVAGFPCQPHSAAGKKQGLNDSIRGDLFYSCIEVIKIKKPKVFILENVKGLLSVNGGNTWTLFQSELESLKKYGYDVQWQILNSRHYGIPQNRPRLYIVGKLNSMSMFPAREHLKLTLEDCIDFTDTTPEHIYPSLANVLKYNDIDKIFVSVQFGEICGCKEYCSCLLTSHASDMWNTILHRRVNTTEWARLQGIDLNVFNNTVSDNQFKRQMGNGMTINVIGRLLKSNCV